MKIEELEIFITPEGEVKYEVRGVKGRRCLDITKDLELDLGGQVAERVETSEMFEQEVEQEIGQRLRQY